VKLFFFMLASILLGNALVCSDEGRPGLDPQDKLIVETVLRLKDFDLESSTKAKSAVLRYLRAEPGTEQFFELIERFKPVEVADDLAAFCLAHSNETSGVRGAELLFAMDRGLILQAFINSDDPTRAISAIGLIGRAAGKQARQLLVPLVTSPTESLAIRCAAVSALGLNIDGQKGIMELVTAAKLSDDLKFIAANVLLSSDDAAIKAEAGKHLQLPATADAQPLPPTAELIKRQGNADAGAVVFRTKGTCINCHKVKGEGKEVGPDLSEIGSKLSRDAVYVSILAPSAAISHNFESYILVTDEGLAFSGLLISDSDESVTLRNREGIDRKFLKTHIEEFEKQKLSLMPQDLQKLLTVDQLVDLVEYVLILRKPVTPQAN